MNARAPHPLLDVPLDEIKSVALRRIIEEVRADSAEPDPGRYNRVHNRHNRS